MENGFGRGASAYHDVCAVVVVHGNEVRARRTVEPPLSKATNLTTMKTRVRWLFCITSTDSRERLPEASVSRARFTLPARYSGPSARIIH